MNICFIINFFVIQNFHVNDRYSIILSLFLLDFHQKMFMTSFSEDLEAANAKATQLAGEAIANVRTVTAFSKSQIVSLFTSNL